MIPETPMRAGVGSALDATIVSPQEEEHSKKMMSMCLALVAKAGEAAITYAEHAGRTKASRNDVHRGLQFQAKTFFDTVTDEEVMEAREDVNKAFDETVSDEEEDEEEDDNEETEEAWSVSTCSCVTCTKMNEAAETWSTYMPDDEVLIYLKGLTDKVLNSS
jgi:hypothetical protein